MSLILAATGANVTILIAFAAGMVSCLSPCVLPLIPGYISYMSGLSVIELKTGEMRTAATSRVLTATAAFIAGLGLMMIAFFSVVQYVLNDILIENRALITTVMGIIVILFGLQMLGLFRFGFLNREQRVQLTSTQVRGPFGAFLLGLAFAFGWIPCISPALSAIIALSADASNGGNAVNGIGLMVVYVLGMGLPFLAAGLLMNRFLAFSLRLRRHYRTVECASGSLLILIGVLIVTGNFVQIAALMGKLSQFGPSL